MHFSLSTTLPLLSTLLPLTIAQSSGGISCQVFEPTAAYQIYSDFPDYSEDLTSSANLNTDNASARYRGVSAKRSQSPKLRRAPFLFEVSQGTDNTDKKDLVAVFSGLPCTGPGPFSFEFNFDPNYVLLDQGQGQINMFRVDVPLNGAPTYNTIEPATGSLIGTFELPLDGQPKLLYLNQLVCQETIVLRFGITRYSAEAGSVAYVNRDGLGLRERNGC